MIIENKNSGYMKYSNMYIAESLSVKIEAKTQLPWKYGDYCVHREDVS